MTPSPPQIIALCGNPTSGKSAVQKFLERHYRYLPIDDGEPLRKFSMDFLGLNKNDVYTQDGKSKFTHITGNKWQNRKILGELGNKLEEMFGQDILPWIATQNLVPGKYYSFGSVRKGQGHFYKKLGGVVIEVVRPGAGPSGNAFDLYDKTAVTHVIENDGDLFDLELKVITLINGIA